MFLVALEGDVVVVRLVVGPQVSANKEILTVNSM